MDWLIDQQNHGLDLDLTLVKEEIEIEEHDLFQNPKLLEVFPDLRVLENRLQDLEGAGDKSHTKEACILKRTKAAGSEKKTYASNAQNNLILTEQLFRSKVVLKDCMTEIIESNRFCSEHGLVFAHSSNLDNHKNLEHYKPVIKKRGRPKKCKRDSDKENEETSDTPKIRYSVKKNYRVKRGCYECEVCKHKFTFKSNMLRHMNKHTNKYVHHCEICDLKFSRSSYLRLHLMVHSKGKHLKCNLCKYKTSCQDYLNAHMKNHAIEKPFKCGKCDSKFSRKAALNQHMRIHTKPYICDMCGYKCAQKSYLEYHLRSHYERKEKPYKCNQCKYRSAQSRTLKIHIRTHTNEKPYKCNVCDHRSARTDTLKIHIKIHHQN